MVFGTIMSRFLDRDSTNSFQPTTENSNQPYLNTFITTQNNRHTTGYISTLHKKKYMKFYEHDNGILTGLINKIARDIGEDIYFEPLNPKESGRNKVLAAEKFYSDNFMQQMYFSIIVDTLVTGEGYTFLNNIKMSDLTPKVDSFLKEKGYPVNDFTRNLLLKANTDEANLTLRNLRYIASSTVENLFDNFEIREYKQIVGANHKLYSPKDIIHLKFMDINGRPNGFTPISSVVTPLELDFFMWQNMNALAKNSGQPDRVYSVEDLDINSAAFKRIERNLKKYHQIQQRHGSLLLNGKIKIDDLQQLDSMQFKDLGFYVASILALQWSIPKSRLPFVVSGSNTKEDTGGNSEKDYYDNINFYQRIIEHLFNCQLWNPLFKVRMKFKRTYLQDEIRETQNQTSRLTNLTSMETILRSNKKQLTEGYKIRYINGINEQVDTEDLEEVEIPDFELDPSAQQPLNDMPNSKDDPKKSSSETNLSERRKTEQDDRIEKRGKPTGFGKEVKIDTPELDYKELEFKESIEVPFKDFIKLYNEDKSSTDNPLRVFVKKVNGIYEFKYKSKDFVYISNIKESDIRPIQLMNFRNLYVLNDLPDPSKSVKDIKIDSPKNIYNESITKLGITPKELDLDSFNLKHKESNNTIYHVKDENYLRLYLKDKEDIYLCKLPRSGTTKEILNKYELKEKITLSTSFEDLK